MQQNSFSFHVNKKSTIECARLKYFIFIKCYMALTCIKGFYIHTKTI